MVRLGQIRASCGKSFVAGENVFVADEYVWRGRFDVLRYRCREPLPVQLDVLHTSQIARYRSLNGLPARRVTLPSRRRRRS